MSFTGAEFHSLAHKFSSPGTGVCSERTEVRAAKTKFCRLRSKFCRIDQNFVALLSKFAPASSILFRGYQFQPGAAVTQVVGDRVGTPGEASRWKRGTGFSGTPASSPAEQGASVARGFDDRLEIARLSPSPRRDEAAAGRGKLSLQPAEPGRAASILA